ncbi:hypothetical protein LCGC14_2853870, partial [marine sediment metagenome]
VRPLQRLLPLHQRQLALALLHQQVVLLLPVQVLQQLEDNLTNSS